MSEQLRSLILEAGSRATFHTILLFSVFMFFSGHNAPGGGFIGGLIAGGAIVIRYLAHGKEEVKKIGRFRPEAVMGIGLLAAVGTGVGALFYGEFLQATFIESEIPLLGKIALTTSLLFDAGVYLIVVGLVVTVLGSFGEESKL